MERALSCLFKWRKAWCVKRHDAWLMTNNERKWSVHKPVASMLLRTHPVPTTDAICLIHNELGSLGTKLGLTSVATFITKLSEVVGVPTTSRGSAGRTTQPSVRYVNLDASNDFAVRCEERPSPLRSQVENVGEVRTAFPISDRRIDSGYSDESDSGCGQSCVSGHVSRA